ncbi:hypothetical protein INT44_006870 [Umbelopsis vinacea]|uniref:DNA damage-binding protein CMR1 n=1 Tax=Umbelopsis vinacea TaxID=44442 RepID=A0A8H7U7Q6_9FUNG|nr:hypothetical protein INT44_006870 [Umbelopsis vinacea]
MSQHLSEYEKKRLDNIEKNKELLKQLNVPAVGSKHGLPPTKSADKRSTVQHKPKAVKKEKLLPVRSSARLRNIPADATTEADLKRTADELLQLSEAKKPKRIAKLEDQDQADFLKILGDAKVDNVMIPNDGPPSDKVPKKLQEEASNLDIRHIWPTIKVTPERINFAAFHPSASKLLACAGDVSGNLGFWDVNGEKEDPDEEAPQPIVYTYRPHTRTITSMMYSPSNLSQLYTSSYDGTVQYFDMEKAEFVTAFEDSESDIPFTAFDMPKDGHSIWFSTSDGTIGHHDLRSPNSEHSMYTVREKKVGGISVNYEQPNYIACASNDRTATIWDIRHLKKKAPEPIKQFEHGFSVSSCYWSPNGDKLLTTSYDNRLRVFSTSGKVDDLEEEFAIEHNNRTGKWVTLFRARWNYNPRALSHSHFVIGSMNHPVEVYSGETGERICELYDPEKVTAVPAVSLFHPTTPSMTILCGNGSGRMVCWT